MAEINQRVLKWCLVVVTCYSLMIQYVSCRVRSWEEAYALAANFTSDLTQTEKLAIMTGTGVLYVAIGPCSGNTGAVERKNYRTLCLQDGPVGVRNQDNSSVFPAGVTTGATFNRGLMYARGYALGEEFKVKGANVALAPVAGPLGRAPAAGRNWEGFGADPYLAGVGVSQSIRGIQDAGVIATAKHYIANEQEHFRLVISQDLSGTAWPITESLSENLDNRTLHELYLWPFVEAVNAGVGAVMCSYNRVNEVYACESSFLGNILRNELGFQGFVMTDWSASATPNLAATAGVDMAMPGDLGALGAAGESILVNGTQTKLDEMVLHIIASWYKMRQDEDYPEIDLSFDGQLNHKTLIREIAAEGMVLVKNTGVLPLGRVSSIGLFGSDGGPNPAGLNSCGEFDACDQGTLAVGWGSGSGKFVYLTTPLDALTAKANVSGISLNVLLDDYDLTSAGNKAGVSQICLAFVNSDSGEATSDVDGNYGDRNNITLWHGGEALIAAVAGNCSNTIVVLHSVGAVLMESWINHPNVTAVLMAHLPGQESGNALVDILFGDVNPSGKLPYTIAKALTDYPATVLYDNGPLNVAPQQTFSEGLFIDYRHFDQNNIVPRFEFGFGLSYTTFTFSNLQVLPLGNPSLSSPFVEIFMVSVEITNSGAREGQEVAQLYLSLPDYTQSPKKQLRGFDKVNVSPGESQTAIFNLTSRDLSYWDGAWQLVSGTVGLSVGASSRDIRLTSTISL